MCDPVSISVLTATAAGGALTAFGQVQQGKAEEGAANYQAQVAKNNAQQAGWAAKDARLQGDAEVTRLGLETAQVAGRGRASAAARGVLVDDGSALSAQQDIAGAEAMDILTIRSNAERRAVGYQNEKNEFLSESQLRKTAGKNAVVGAGLAATGTLLSSGASVGSKWYSMRGGYG